MRSALLLIEFQHEWLHPSGRLHHLAAPGLLELATARAARALGAARERGLPIVHAGLRFAPGHPELGHARHGLRAGIKRVGSFRADGPGSGFVAPFVPEGDEFVVAGRIGASAFAGSNLDAYLRAQEIRQLYLAGFALHVCVAATAWAAQDLGYAVTILDDAVAAFDEQQQTTTLEHVVHHFGERLGVAGFCARIEAARP